MPIAERWQSAFASSPRACHALLLWHSGWGWSSPITAARLMTPATRPGAPAGAFFWRPAMNTLQGFVLVFVGAGLGGVLRHTTNLLTLRLVGPDLPAGTFLVNLLGSLAIGGVAGFVASRGHGAQALHLFLAT